MKRFVVLFLLCSSMVYSHPWSEVNDSLENHNLIDISIITWDSYPTINEVKYPEGYALLDFYNGVKLLLVYSSNRITGYYYALPGSPRIIVSTENFVRRYIFTSVSPSECKIISFFY